MDGDDVLDEDLYEGETSWIRRNLDGRGGGALPSFCCRGVNGAALMVDAFRCEVEWI
jgi:hypothetical protein